jgi:hypothetical protein
MAPFTPIEGFNILPLFLGDRTLYKNDFSYTIVKANSILNVIDTASPPVSVW